MTTKQIRSLAMLAILPCMQFIQSAHAQLPMLKHQPWMSYFAVAEDRAFQFLFARNGMIAITALTKAGSPIKLPISLKFLALETLPDGSVRELAMAPGTLESSDPATDKLKKTVFRSKLTNQATGQPTLEVTIEIANGTILTNARITDKGSFTQNPLLPVVRVVFPAFYGSENSVKSQWGPKRIKDFEKEIGKDAVILKHLDRTRVKLDCVDKIDAKSKEVNGPGSASAEVDISAFQKRKIDVIAAHNSSITLGNAGPASLHDGFWLQWSPDTVKDTNNIAKLAITIK